MNLAATLSLDNSKFINPIAQAQRSTGSLIGTLGNLGNIVTGLSSLKGALSAALAPLREPITLAADLESLTAEFEVMLGSASKAKTMLDEIRDFANVTPFETSGLASNARLLLSFGVSAETIVPTLKMLGDVAGTSQEKLDRLTLAFAQINSAGRLQGQDLLQLINAGFNPLQEISRKTGESMASLRQKMEGGAISAQMVTDAFKSATSEGGRFFGNMEKQSQTFNGLLSTMTDAWHELLRSFGTPVMLSLKQYLVEGTKLLGDMKAKAVELGERLAYGIKFAFEAYKSGNLGELLGLGLQVGLGQAVNYFTEGMRIAIGGLTDALGIAFSEQFFGGVTTAFAGVGLSITGILLKAFQEPLIRLQSVMEFCAENFSSVLGKGISQNLGLISPLLKLLDNASGGKLGNMIDEVITRMGSGGRSYEQIEAERRAQGVSYGGFGAQDFLSGGSKLISEGSQELKKSLPEITAVFKRLQSEFATMDPADIAGITDLKAKLKGVTDQIAKQLKDAEWKKFFEDLNSNFQGSGVNGSAAANEAAGGVKPAVAPILTDRLAQIGGFVGMGGGYSDSSKETARNTMKTNEKLDAVIETIKAVFSPDMNATVA